MSGTVATQPRGLPVVRQRQGAPRSQAVPHEAHLSQDVGNDTRPLGPSDLPGSQKPCSAW